MPNDRFVAFRSYICMRPDHVPGAPKLMMMTRYALSFLLVVLGYNGTAQLLTLTDEDGMTVPSGSTYVHHGAPETDTESVHLTATLNGTESKDVNMRRIELTVQPGTQNYYCWGVCYDAIDAGLLPIWNSLGVHALPMNGGEPVTNFAGYHRPQGLEGTSTYRYVWFDVDNRDDSVWVDIEFQITAVGIEENGALARLSVFPNPSKGADVQFEVDMPALGGATALVIHNAVGQRIRTTPVRSGQPIARLSTEGLAPGLYFATLDHKGRGLVTQRFVVSGR